MTSLQPDVEHERDELLERIAGVLETPMAILGAVWLLLLVLEFTSGLNPLLERVGEAIWILFLLDFGLRFLIAPQKGAYLRRHWLSALSLALPALRIFRAFRGWRALSTVRVARGTRLFRLVASMNRGMRALSATFARRGFGYVVALTVAITLGGAAGMYAFEREVPGSPIASYADALWWTAMIMTTMGSEYWPQTAEGRLLCLLLSLYAFAVFGYVTATLASFFIDRDAERPDAPLAGAAAVAGLVAEVTALRAELRAYATQR